MNTQKTLKYIVNNNLLDNEKGSSFRVFFKLKNKITIMKWECHQFTQMNKEKQSNTHFTYSLFL